MKKNIIHTIIYTVNVVLFFPHVTAVIMCLIELRAQGEGVDRAQLIHD